MSFDLAVLSGRQPLDPDTAEGIYQRLCRGEDWRPVLEADPSVSEFVKDITQRWPHQDELSWVPPDDNPWGEFEVSPAHVLTAILWSRVEAVVPVYIDTALKHGLHVFDPQEGLLHSPGHDPRSITPREPEVRICSSCGKLIEPGELSAEQPGKDGVHHLRCLFKGFPV